MNRLTSCHFIFLLLISPAISQEPATIRINFSETFQTIDHFGASDCWSMQKIGEWDEVAKIRVADLLFSPTKGIGLTGWRFNLGGGLNTKTITHPWRTVETFYVGPHQYDWTRQAEERWFLQAAKERGVERFTAFVNSPPGKMNINGTTNCTDGLGSTNLKNGYEAQFALYLVDVLKHFRDQWDIAFDYISPVNEPQWEWNNGSNQEGNRASNPDIIAIVNALDAELQKQKVETKISIIESGDLKSWYISNQSMESEYGEKYGDYLRQVIGHEDISEKISRHFCGHSYWSDRLGTQLVQHRESAKRFFRSFLNDGWEYWMTEYCILDGPEGAGGRGRDLSIKTALDVARVIHYDLTILNASAWNWWTAVSPEDYKDGLLYTNYKDNPGDKSVIESKTLWALGNYSRFIRPGAVRIEVSGADDKEALMASGYINAEKDKIFIVALNVSQNAAPLSFQVAGLQDNQHIQNLAPYLTSNAAGDDLRQLASFPTDKEFSLPPRSIVTLVGDIKTLDNINYRDEPDNPKRPRFFCYPNPFNGDITIQLQNAASSNASLTIFNYRGQVIKSLPPLRDGRFYRWNGRNNQGAAAPSGSYFVQMGTAEELISRRIVLIR